MIEAIIYILIGVIIGVIIIILLCCRQCNNIDDGLEAIKESNKRLEGLQQATSRDIGELEELQSRNEDRIESIEELIQRIESNNTNQKN